MQYVATDLEMAGREKEEIVEQISGVIENQGRGLSAAELADCLKFARDSYEITHPVSPGSPAVIDGEEPKRPETPEVIKIPEEQQISQAQTTEPELLVEPRIPFETVVSTEHPNLDDPEDTKAIQVQSEKKMGLPEERKTEGKAVSSDGTFAEESKESTHSKSFPGYKRQRTVAEMRKEGMHEEEIQTRVSMREGR